MTFTEPMAKLLSDKPLLDYPIEFDLHHGSTPEDLFEFGESLSKGTHHIGIVWGLEYGWLREKYPDLVPIVVCLVSKDLFNRSQLMVRKQPNRARLQNIRGGTLGRFERTTLMDELFLHEVLTRNHEDPKNFFQTRILPTAKDAVFELHDGGVDCMVITIDTLKRLEPDCGEVIGNLAMVEQSGPFPNAMLIGRPEHLNRLRPGLWTDLQEALIRIHKKSVGRRCVKFWGLERFVRPDAETEELIKEAVKMYPVEVLSKLR